MKISLQNWDSFGHRVQRGLAERADGGRSGVVSERQREPDTADWTAFVTALATRYKGRVAS